MSSRVGSAMNTLVHSALNTLSSRQSPPALPRIPAETPSAPAASAITAKPADAAAAGNLPPGAVPYLKGAGMYVPPGTANGPVEVDGCQLSVVSEKTDNRELRTDNSSPIPVKNHLRKPPQPLTLEDVLDQFRLYELRPLLLGRFCVQWLQHQPELAKEQQLARGEALKKIREGLAKQDQISLAARLDRFIACYWIAMELGWNDACKLRYAAIRELLPLFGRNAATEEYVLRPERAEATRALWARMVSDHLTAETVRSEVRRIRPPQTVRMHGRSGRLAAIRRDTQRLKAREDLLAVIRFAQERMERLGLVDKTVVA